MNNVFKAQEELESFVFYETFFFTLQRIKDPVERCNAYDTLAQYGLYGKIPGDISSERIQQLMENAIPLIEAAKKRRIASKINGKRGGRPKKNWNNSQKPSNNLTETYAKPNQNLNVNVNVNDNVNGNVNENINNSCLNKKIINEQKNNNELIGIDDEKNIDGQQIEREEKSSVKKEEKNISIDDIVDDIISTSKEWIEKHNNKYDSTNERKFALSILQSDDIKEFIKEKHCTMKEFIIGTINGSYVGYVDNFYRIDSLYKLFYNYKTIYDTILSNEGKRVAALMYWKHLGVVEMNRKFNEIYQK